jgi:hypothetical protein
VAYGKITNSLLLALLYFPGKEIRSHRGCPRGRIYSVGKGGRYGNRDPPDETTILRAHINKTEFIIHLTEHHRVPLIRTLNWIFIYLTIPFQIVSL